MGTLDRRSGLIVGVLTLMLLVPAAPAAAVVPAVDPFHRTWMRTDKPVGDAAVDRTWMWGPLADGYHATEPYRESPDGEREVVYFDKSRMEVSHPDAQDDGVWYVTNGLLVVELVTGQLQLGDAEHEGRQPAEVNIAGDPGQHPTYADIGRAGLRNAAPADVGDALIAVLHDDNSVTDDPAYADTTITAAVHVPETNHTVASPFWSFMTSGALVYEDGRNVSAPLFQNPFYATGYPITEAYWSSVDVGGQERDVLWQCFERRCLTYAPGNPTGWQVEAGNVGLHYYQWRHGATRPEPERMTVTFRLFHDGAQIATTVTHEVFFGDTAVGAWTTTDPSGAVISRGTLDANHALSGIDALILQDWPYPGNAELRFDYGIGIGGITGSGSVTYVADAPSGVLSGTTTFEALTTSLDVWDVTLDEVPPVLFGGD